MFVGGNSVEKMKYFLFGSNFENIINLIKACTGSFFQIPHFTLISPQFSPSSLTENNLYLCDVLCCDHHKCCVLCVLQSDSGKSSLERRRRNKTSVSPQFSWATLIPHRVTVTTLVMVTHHIITHLLSHLFQSIGQCKCNFANLN